MRQGSGAAGAVALAVIAIALCASDRTCGARAELAVKQSGEAAEGAGILFVIRCAPQARAVLPRLINALYHRDHEFVVLDQGFAHHSNALDAISLRGMLSADTRVLVLPPSAINPRGISAVLAQIDAVQMALCDPTLRNAWSHVVFLQADDYPLASSTLLSQISRALLRDEQTAFFGADIKQAFCGSASSTADTVRKRGLTMSLLDVAAQSRWPEYSTRYNSTAYDQAIAANIIHAARTVKERAAQSTETVTESDEYPILGTDLVTTDVPRWYGRNTRANENALVPNIPRCSRIGMISRDVALCALSSAEARRLWVALSNSDTPEEHFWCALVLFGSELCASPTMDLSDAKSSSVVSSNDVSAHVASSALTLNSASEHSSLDTQQQHLALFVASLNPLDSTTRDVSDGTRNGFAARTSEENAAFAQWNTALARVLAATARAMLPPSENAAAFARALEAWKTPMR